MLNNFFKHKISPKEAANRLHEIEVGKVGFYSIGLYPASLAYNCAMQQKGDNLLLAVRPGRNLFGAFDNNNLDGMDPNHVETIKSMGTHLEGNKIVNNNLSDLLLRCELVILSSNSNHIENDLAEALKLRETLNRQQVLLAVLAGSFCHDDLSNESYVLCEKEPLLGFFSGFHRHGALRNPLDSFTGNFCHPDAFTAMLAARMLDKLSPNIQVSAGVHNIEAQYIKAAKNMSSIFAGFGYTFHKDNEGLLPTLLTLLLNQCLDQAASVSMCRKDRKNLYENQNISLTELGYGVPKIEAALLKDTEAHDFRDHTFAQLTAIVADVKGSMMEPSHGIPTRNFQAGQILAIKMREIKRCPENINELLGWCSESDIRTGSLEGLKSLKFWPQILEAYSIPLNDSSMVNLLYMCIYGPKSIKSKVYDVMTQSRELTNYCQESVRPSHSRFLAEALNHIDRPEYFELLVDTVLRINKSNNNSNFNRLDNTKNNLSPYLQVMNFIEENI